MTTAGTKRAVAVALIALIASAAPVQAAPTRAEQQSYVAAGSDFFSPKSLSPSCMRSSTPQPFGACFLVQPGDLSVRVTIADDLTSRACGSVVMRELLGAVTVHNVYFVGQSPEIRIPARTAYVTVNPIELFPAYGAGCSASNGPGTVGVITASFAQRGP